MNRSSNSMIERGVLVLANIGAACTLCMLLLICSDVAARTLFGSPLPLVMEFVANWLMVGLVFLPLALVGTQKHHIEVEMFAGLLPPAGQRVLWRLGRILVAIFFALLVYSSFGPAITATRIGESSAATILDLPIWPVRWVVLVSCAVAVVVEIQILLKSNHE